MNSDKLKSALLGAMAGLIAGILIAPKSGKETRADIKETLEKLKDDISSKLSDLKDISKDSYEKTISDVVDSYEKDNKISQKQAAEIRKNLDEGFEKIRKKLNER